MTGRGIDQVLPHPCDPVLHEAYVRSADQYVRLAEDANGLIPRPVDPPYVWGAALDEFNLMRPDARIINLESSITRSEDFVRKGINYRMSPDNAACLEPAAIDCCTLANNHVLDWGRSGLVDTLSTLERLQIRTAGAGRTLEEARAPAVLEIGQGSRLLVFALALPTSGVPRQWAATSDLPGVNFLRDLPQSSIDHVCAQVARERQPGDIVVVSIHWGSNWGYEVTEEQRRFARALVERGDVNIVHGHSSHHAKAIEVFRDRLILYGCGDFLNDYEGIRGYEIFRGDLALMYFADIDRDRGDLVRLTIVPLQIRQFRLTHPSPRDVEWLQNTLDRESRSYATRVALAPDGRLELAWRGTPAPAG